MGMISAICNQPGKERKRESSYGVKQYWMRKKKDADKNTNMINNHTSNSKQLDGKGSHEYI